MGATAPTATLQPLSIARRALRAGDVDIRITHCGVCHSDLHTCRGDWGPAHYPLVPGHEIVGEVVGLGRDVTRFQIGQRVAVGTLVDSCGECAQCLRGHQQYCLRGNTATYNSVDAESGDTTQGGYSERIVVDARFVLRVPDGLDSAAAAPVLCAGITVWSPLRHWEVGPGTRLGVVGLGGLGHMAVKLGAALGADVGVFTRSPDKAEEAGQLGASHTVVSTDRAQLKRARGQYDVIIDTVPVAHDLGPYLASLAVDGTLVIVGAIAPLEFHGARLITGRKSIAGSLTGGVAETQELLDFCAEHGVGADVEAVALGDVNQAWQRMEAGDVRYRFVIDMGR